MFKFEHRFETLGPLLLVHERAGGSRTGRGGRREVEGRLECLHPAAQAVRQDAVDLRECTFDRLRRAGKPELACRDDS